MWHFRVIQHLRNVNFPTNSSIFQGRGISRFFSPFTELTKPIFGFSILFAVRNQTLYISPNVPIRILLFRAQIMLDLFHMAANNCQTNVSAYMVKPHVTWLSCVPVAPTDGRRQSRSTASRAIQVNGLGQLLASAVLLSMDHEHGTDYLQHFGQQNLPYARSSVS